MRKFFSSSTMGQRESRATTMQGAVDREAARNKGIGQHRTSLCDLNRSEN
jgi:hypothetical protein